MKAVTPVLFAAAAFLILGWVGHEDYQTQIMQDVVTECNASQGRSLNCHRLIAEVQKDGRHEVLADQWAEGSGWNWYVETK